MKNRSLSFATIILVFLMSILAMSLSACAKQDIYHIDFFVGEELVSSCETANLQKAVFPFVEAEYGYAFDNWYTESGLVVRKENLKKSLFESGRLSLYAKFECLHYLFSELETIAPTCIEDGLSRRYCNVCQTVYSVTLKKTGHDFIIEEYDDDYHWKKCSRCGEKSKITRHSISWTVTEKGSCNEKEIKAGHCSGCAVNLTVVADDYTHCFEQYDFDDSGHWQICSICGVESPKSFHSYENDTCICSFFTRRTSLSGSLLNVVSKNIPISQNFDNSTNEYGGTLDMVTIDVGQGESIFFRFPDGTTMLMDAGTADIGTTRFNKIKAVLDAYSVTTIDYLFITHCDYDHVRAVDKVIDKYEVKNAYIPMVADNMSNSWKEVVKALSTETYTKSDGTRANTVIRYNIGDYEISGEGWRMRCYTYLEKDYPTITASAAKFPNPTQFDLEADHADIVNAISPMCFLEYAGRVILLTGDSNKYNEKYLLNRNVLGDCDVLKVAHHGSKTSTTEEFADAVSAEYAVISCSNMYGHPTEEVIKTLSSCLKIFVTKNDSSIYLIVKNTGEMCFYYGKNKEYEYKA